MKLVHVTAAKESMPLNQALPLANVRILFVEDVAELRELMIDFLEELGAEVTAVTLAKQALSAIEQTKFDLLLSDISLPEQDGCWLINQIRVCESQRTQAQLPAIALTAAVREVDRSRALAAGFQQYITKPFMLDDLSAQIINLVKPNQEPI